MKFSVRFAFCWFAILVSMSLAQPYHVISVDGSVGEWQGNEKVATESQDDASFGTTNNLDALYVTWDSRKLYLRISGAFENANGNGFVVFLDVKYGSASNSGVNNLTDLTDNAGALDALITNPAFSETDANFKADYAIGSFQRNTILSGNLSDNAGMRGWGGDGGRGGSTGNFAWLDGVDLSFDAGGTECEIGVSWNKLYGLGEGKVPTDAKLGIVVGYGSTGGGTADETLPTNGSGNGGNFTSIYVVDIDSDDDGFPDVGVKTGDAGLGTDATVTPSRPNNSTTYTSAKTIDGSLADWHQNEFIGPGRSATPAESQMRYFITWDASNFYVAFAGLGNGTDDRFNVAIDVNPNQADDDMAAFAGVTFQANFEPDYVYQWNGSSLNKFQANGSSWQDVADDGSGADSNTDPVIVELQIPRSGIGNPGTGQAIGFYLWAANAANADYDAYPGSDNGNTPDNQASAQDLTTEFGFTFTGSGVQVNQNIAEDISLPVNLSLFVAIPQSQRVVLRWITESEVNNEAFLVQRSEDNKFFVTIGEVSGQGNSSQRTEYEFVDPLVVPGKTYYYRLADRDFNGNITFHYSIQVTIPLAGSETPSGPSRFFLYPNYPNPFNPSTHIRFDVPGGQTTRSVRLSVFDARGRLVQVLLDEEMPPGQHEVIWFGRNRQGQPVPSGVYYLRMESGFFSQTQTMVLV
ncbi:MAG: hypothetical protein D6715_08680, partial [Calditrichaeota bacterium]